jgi:hypothetical protein
MSDQKTRLKVAAELRVGSQAAENNRAEIDRDAQLKQLVENSKPLGMGLRPYPGHDVYHPTQIHAGN